MTLGVYIKEAKYKENLKWLGLAILGQFLGAFIAMLLTEITLFEKNLGDIPADNVAKICP